MAGNVSVVAAGPTITVDTLAPQRPTLDLPAAKDSGQSNLDGVTNAANPISFTLTADAGTTVVVKDGDTVILGPTSFDTLDAADGTVDGVATISLTLSEGSHLLSAESTDVAGNVSDQSEELVVTVDRTAPATPSGPAMLATSDTGAFGRHHVDQPAGLQWHGRAERVGSDLRRRLVGGPGRGDLRRRHTRSRWSR